jgi:large subunit ribosomal protein L13
MKTYSPKPEHIVRRWYVVDASGQVLGRLASEVAAILRGKHKPIFAPHMDTGDHVIVVNADKIELTGGKEAKKISYRHSGYPGGIKGTRYDVLMAERPVFVIEKAIRGMLPKNSLGRSMLKKLHVIVGPEHPHQAQQPVAYTLGQPPVWEGLPEKPSRVKATAPSPDKPSAKRPAARPKAGAKTTATSPVKKTTAKKPAARKPTATTAKKSAARKPAASKGAAEKASAGKPRARKPAEKDEEE